MLRTLPVDPGPLGLVSAGQPDAIYVWEEQGGRRVLTEKPETDDDGVPLWTCYLMPTAAERPEVLQVRVPAKVQPVVTLFGPIDVAGLEVGVRVDKAGKLAQYWSASEVRDAGQGHRRNGSQEHKAAEAPA